ncbi:MAG: DEAD/DEAH box helicase family protein [Thermoleophilaceae bacterium]|nr:DEAD/DEAH box helicase family protein [Thermoleophilaceae bacterium]
MTLPPWPKDRPLRAWQLDAVERLSAHTGTSFLASATPAAGKTTFGLRVAHDMLSSGRVKRVVVAGPTTHICRQWALAAARVGIDLEPNRPNGDGAEPSDLHGVAVTYQTIASGPRIHALAASRRPTLLIADEPHHMGDQASWGVAARTAFDGAAFRLLLSGTPFRSDNSAIPWVDYDNDGMSRADHTYGYPQALIDRVCRPITFLPYDGEMEWRSDGRLRSANFETVLPRAEDARRLRTALEADGDWMGEVLEDADEKLTDVRDEGHAEAGGLVICSDQEHARAVAARLMRITGEKPEIVMSDEPEGSARIARFAEGRRRWLVSVLMVSEGVDIPRLRVGVYATPARTELFFRQVVGRFIRRTPAPARQMSYLLLPADIRLKRLAHEIEDERRHALELMNGAEDEELEERAERTPAGVAFEALSSSGQLEGTIMSGTALQLFATEDPEPVKASRGRSESADATFVSREKLRDQRAYLVSELSRKRREPHSRVQSWVNNQTGATSVKAATREQLEKGNALLVRQLTGR